MEHKNRKELNNNEKKKNDMINLNAIKISIQNVWIANLQYEGNYIDLSIWNLLIVPLPDSHIITNHLDSAVRGLCALKLLFSYFSNSEKAVLPLTLNIFFYLKNDQVTARHSQLSDRA